MSTVLTIGAVHTAGEIPGNGCLASVGDINGGIHRLEWIFREDPTPSLVGAGTKYPVAMSLDQLMEIYWRWRKLECALSVTLDSSTTTATVSDLERSHAGGSAFTTEASMMQPAPWKIEYSSATLGLEGFTASPYPATWTTLSLRILDDSAVNVYHDG